MRRFIFGERDGIYIIDLLQTEELLENARRFASDVARRGGTVLFVGTKKQARDAVKDTAEASEMPFVNHRWLGGLLTNFQTISLRIRRLHDLERYANEGQLELLPTRERMAAQADLEKLRANLGGVKDMQRVPDAVFVIDLKTELIAVKEAQRLRIPIIGLVDTNCDPDGIDFVIRSCALITQAIGEVVAEGHSVFRAEEERARKEAEEKARIEAEARAKREAEEQAKREAEEQAKKAAEEKAAAEQAAAALQQQPAAAAPAAATTAPAAAPAPPAPAAPSQDAPPPPAAPSQAARAPAAAKAPDAPAKAPDAPAKAPAEKATAEKAAAAAAAQQPAPEPKPVSATPVDPATLEPQTESVTPMNASPDSSQPAKEQYAPPETAAESEA